MSRSISKSGLKFIIDHEAIVNHLYICPGGFLTIGVGHLCLQNDYYLKGSSIKELVEIGKKYGQTIKITNKLDNNKIKTFFVKIGQGWDKTFSISEEESFAIFQKDLQKFTIPIFKNVKVPLTDNQFAACASLAFNIGIGTSNGTRGFLSSSLFRNINSGRFELIRDGFSRYVYSDGKILPGLVSRRKEEADLFFTPDNISDFPQATQSEIKAQYEKYMIKRSLY